MESPYGNPIPGLEELGGPAADAADFRTGVISLTDAVAGYTRGCTVVIRRLGEPLQTDVDVMSRLARAGVRPGRAVRAGRATRGVELQVGDVLLELSSEVASHVFVVAPVAAPAAS